MKPLDATSPLPEEVAAAYEKANEAACCECSVTTQYGQECCGNPVPRALVDEAAARDLGVAVYKNWQNLFAVSEKEQPKERLARITIRNPDHIKRVIIEVCGRREVLEAGEKIDLALAEKDLHV